MVCVFAKLTLYIEFDLNARLFSGKARISVRVNDEGEVTGAGDFLYPIYDSERTAVFTQIGLRTMTGDRVIGNFGLGQRFFPAESFALGYNVFLDQDFSRNHTRGGVGVEGWYDWVRLSANYYTPLSGWRDSKDYDHRLVEERPAEGYDARLTGYLPFYQWADATPIDKANSFPAAETVCSGKVNDGVKPVSWPPDASSPYWEETTKYYYYAVASNLPKVAQLQAVSAYNSKNNPNGKGAAFAAGWSSGHYWTGEVYAYTPHARFVSLAIGYNKNANKLDYKNPVVCLRP